MSIDDIAEKFINKVEDELGQPVSRGQKKYIKECIEEHEQCLNSSGGDCIHTCSYGSDEDLLFVIECYGCDCDVVDSEILDEIKD